MRPCVSLGCLNVGDGAIAHAGAETALLSRVVAVRDAPVSVDLVARCWLECGDSNARLSILQHLAPALWKGSVDTQGPLEVAEFLRWEWWCYLCHHSVLQGDVEMLGALLPGQPVKDMPSIQHLQALTFRVCLRMLEGDFSIADSPECRQCLLTLPESSLARVWFLWFSLPFFFVLMEVLAFVFSLRSHITAPVCVGKTDFLAPCAWQNGINMPTG